jgi:hypothetical protein
MNNLVLSPIPLTEMENLIKVAVKNAFENYFTTNKFQPESHKMNTIIVTTESQLNELIAKSVNLEFRRVCKKI